MQKIGFNFIRIDISFLKIKIYAWNIAPWCKCKKKYSILERKAKYCDQQVFSDEVEITIILIEWKKMQTSFPTSEQIAQLWGVNSLWNKNLPALTPQGRSRRLRWQKRRGTMYLSDRFQSLPQERLGTTDLPRIKTDDISSLRQSNQNGLGLNPTILMDKCRWLKASWATLVPHQGYLFSCMVTVLSFLQGISSCPECKGNLDIEGNWCKSLVHHLAPLLGGNNLKHLQKRKETYRRWVYANMDREVKQNTPWSSNTHMW